MRRASSPLNGPSPALRRGRLGLLILASLGGLGNNCTELGDELPVDAAQPYNAVGYINNGCTGWLIDADHVVAAGHCFTNTTTGEWQTGLRFYPNFHPDRVDADAAHVPRADITRVVVGSRSAESALGVGMDWGIARLDNWRDAAGLDLTPMDMADAMPAVGTQVVNPAYNRHHCPYDDHDGEKWDNMERDSMNCNPPAWIREMQDPPLYDGTHPDSVWCNSRWISATIHRDCSVTSYHDDIVEADCEVNGGSSGSPIIATGSHWTAIGVVHGGVSPDFADATPDCTIASRGGGATVDRFRDAPRMAANVAVHRRPDNPAATAVFAVDADRDVVTVRYREDAAPTWSSPFAYWDSLGGPGGELTQIAACSADDAGHPRIFVIGDEDTLHTRAVDGTAAWGAWSTVDLPASMGQLLDVDASTDDDGKCLVVIAGTGGVHVRPVTGPATFGPWTTAATGSWEKVTALRYENVLEVGAVDTSGQAWRLHRREGVWAGAEALGFPGGVSAWQDVDMTWDEAARGFMVATPVGGDDRLYFAPMYGTEPWTWHWLETHLWAPGADVQDAPQMLSLTASRWLEDPAGTTSPVVFGTDGDGNVYFVEYSHVGTPGWVLDWKSFYHERIVY